MATFFVLLFLFCLWWLGLPCWVVFLTALAGLARCCVCVRGVAFEFCFVAGRAFSDRGAPGHQVSWACFAWSFDLYCIVVGPALLGLLLGALSSFAASCRSLFCLLCFGVSLVCSLLVGSASSALGPAVFILLELPLVVPFQFCCTRAGAALRFSGLLCALLCFPVHSCAVQCSPGLSCALLPCPDLC